MQMLHCRQVSKSTAKGIEPVATITITGVDNDVKRALTIACVEQGTSVSREVRERLVRIIDEVRGDVERKDADLQVKLDAALAELESVKATNHLMTRAMQMFPEEDVKLAIRRAKAPGISMETWRELPLGSSR